MDYKEILKACRLRKGWTQQRLSFEIHYSREVVSKIETGRKQVDLHTFLHWVRATSSEQFILDVLGITSINELNVIEG